MFDVEILDLLPSLLVRQEADKKVQMVSRGFFFPQAKEARV